MKNKLICSILVIMMLSAFACKKAEDAPIHETPAPSPTPSAAIVVMDEMPVHSDSWEDILNEEVQPPDTVEFTVSPTTGRDIDLLHAYKPVCVCLDNAATVRPLSGIAEADIVYEAPAATDGGATRLMALFSDAYPAEVGPVGMLYPDFAAMQKEWEGVTIHVGYPDGDEYPKLNEGDFVLRATNDGDAEAFFFTHEESENQYVKLDGLVEKLYTMSPPVAMLRFLLAAGYVYDDAEAAKKIRLPFGGGKAETVEYAFDADNGTYRRYQVGADGKMTGSTALSWNEETQTLESVPLNADSLIVQYVEIADGAMTLVGSGKCDFFVSGVKLTGTWARASADGATEYYLDDGSMVTLASGHTWIALHPADTPAKVL